MFDYSYCALYYAASFIIAKTLFLGVYPSYNYDRDCI